MIQTIIPLKENNNSIKRKEMILHVYFQKVSPQDHS